MADKWAKGCRGWYEPIPVKHHVNGCHNLLSKCSYWSCPLEPKNRLHWTIYLQVLSSIGLIILYCFVGIERQSVLQRDFFNKLVQTDRWRIVSTFPIYPSLGGHHSKSELSQSVRGILNFWFNLGRPQIVTKTSPMHVIYPCIRLHHIRNSPSFSSASFPETSTFANACHWVSSLLRNSSLRVRGQLFKTLLRLKRLKSKQLLDRHCRLCTPTTEQVTSNHV